MSTEAMNHPTERKPDDETLFHLPEVELAGSDSEIPLAGRPRMQRPDRHQVAIRMLALDALLGEDHQARLVWQYVDGLDMTPLYDLIRAVEGRAGRNPIDPKILMALWLQATLNAVGSARQLAQLCEDHVAYQWICGGVSVNYHTLSDFRTAHVEFLDQLLTDSVATLMHQDLVTLHRVAQDGMRVRASAGASSFRRRQTLEECRSEARRQVDTLRKELQADPGASSKRQKAARQRAARERAEKIQRALDEMPKAESKKTPDKKDKARVSTTDPEARVMKMPDGGFRPAYNVEIATDTASQVITGVDTINSGSDQGQMSPIVQQHSDRYGQTPKETLVDGGFAKHEDIEKVSSGEAPTVVYAPVQKPKKDARDPHEPRPGDSETIAEWRRRMGTAEAKAIYKDRASTAECVNAIARNRGLQRFLVRGLQKVRAVTLWFALAHNLMRAVSLRAEAAAIAG
jgi:transposase